VKTYRSRLSSGYVALTCAYPFITSRNLTDVASGSALVPMSATFKSIALKFFSRDPRLVLDPNSCSVILLQHRRFDLSISGLENRFFQPNYISRCIQCSLRFSAACVWSYPSMLLRYHRCSCSIHHHYMT
jgi:hypothetical protein